MQHIEIQENEEKLDLRKILGKYLVKWPWFIGTVLLFLIGAFIYLRYSVPQYQTTTTLKFDKKQSDITGALVDLENLGLGLGNADELKSEVAVVNSRPILMKVVQNLNLNVQYYNAGEFKDSELFAKIPIIARVISYSDEKKFVSSEYMVKEVNGNTFVLEDGEKKTYQRKF